MHLPYYNFKNEQILENIKDNKIKFDNIDKLLNKDQKKIFTGITEGTNKLYFIDGPGGCGKTFLCKTLLYYYFWKGKKNSQWLG